MAGSRLGIFAIVAALLGALAASSASGKQPAGYQIIVHPSNPAKDVDKAFLRDAFLKRSPLWPHEVTIRPVDLQKDFEVRGQFSRDVLNKSVTEVKNYWHQQVFSGKGVPPPELESEAAVISYVLRSPGAIGYLSPGTDPGGTKVIPVK